MSAVPKTAADGKTEPLRVRPATLITACQTKTVLLLDHVSQPGPYGKSRRGLVASACLPTAMGRDR